MLFVTFLSVSVNGMATSVMIWVTFLVIATEAIPCNDTYHCSDCDGVSGDCFSECDTGYYGRKCNSTCSKNCRNNKCVISSYGSDNCNDGCVQGYQGIGCNIPCDSPGGNCTACPGGCDGGYCQLGSFCVSGCVDSHYGTGCNEKSGEIVGLLVGLAAATVLIIVTITLAVCWCCQALRNDRFQLYVTPTQDMHVSPEAIDVPQYDVVDEAKMYDVRTGGEQPACASRSGYAGMRSVHHSIISRDLEHAGQDEPGTTSVTIERESGTSSV
ncbi:lectin-like [Haliotis rufescens]|uniref:lectin-like n=1 Tax=Haliotis rufescens TaxID=6454 RepID=UPI00201F11AA|nr:lectin-like [Haliotis rufescens]